MSWSIGYEFAEGVIVIEFMMVILIVLLTLFLKLFYYLLDKHDNRIKNKIAGYVSKLLLNQQKFNSRKLAYSWRSIYLLLDVIDEFDATHPVGNWHDTIRPELITTVLLPLARKYVKSRDWQYRFYAAKSFGLIRHKDNQKYITTLINDPIPLVSVYAGKAALVNHDEEAINALINKLSSESWSNQLIYLHEFGVLPETSRPYIVKKLEQARDAKVRSTIYKILMKYPPQKIQWNIKEDIHSSDKELTIAALKYAAFSDPDLSVPFLIEALSSLNTQVKLIAIHRLSLLQVDKATPQLITCLKDKDWWVRISAALALKNMGAEGMAAIKAHDIDLVNIAFNYEHLMNTWW